MDVKWADRLTGLHFKAGFFFGEFDISLKRMQLLVMHSKQNLKLSVPL